MKILELKDSEIGQSSEPQDGYLYGFSYKGECSCCGGVLDVSRIERHDQNGIHITVTCNCNRRQP